MNYKSVNRFFLFAVALLTALYFFGVKPSHLDSNSISSFQVSDATILKSIHQPGVPHPEGVESKEEQPSEDDDENVDSDDSSDGDNGNDHSGSTFGSLSGTDEVIASSRGSFHCPLYIRIHSIII